jgi:hypothetical protein
MTPRSSASPGGVTSPLGDAYQPPPPPQTHLHDGTAVSVIDSALDELTIFIGAQMVRTHLRERVSLRLYSRTLPPTFSPGDPSTLSASECIRVHLNASECIRVHLRVSECI